MNATISQLPGGRFLVQWGNKSAELTALESLRMLEASGKIEFTKNPTRHPGEEPEYLRTFAYILVPVIAEDGEEDLRGYCSNVLILASRFATEWPNEIALAVVQDPELSKCITEKTIAA